MFGIDSAHGETPIDPQRHIVKFDSRGRCIESAISAAMANSTVRTFYKYDSRGDLIRETDYDSDGKIFSRQVRTYRPDHKLLSERAMGNPGKTMAHQWSREYQYDARGNQTDMLLYQQGVLEAHWKSTYDERNRRIAVQTIVADTKKDQQVNGECSDCGLSSGVTTYKYDDAGQVIEQRKFQLGDKLVSVERYLYDAHRNRLPSAESTYLYDSHGNWIQEASPSPAATYIRYRVIDYY